MIKLNTQPLSWNALTLVLTNLVLAALLAGAWIQFGSIQNAINYVNGQRLLVDEPSTSLGNIDTRTQYSQTFMLTNVSNKDINVIGAKTSCFCVATDDLPMMIPPQSKRPIKVKINPRTETGKFRETVHLFTDYGAQHVVTLNLSAVALDSRR